MRALRVARVAFVRASWSRPPLRMASAAQLDAGPVADFKAATSSARRRASAAKSVSSLPTLVAPAALALARARASSRPDSVPVDGHDQTTSTLASEEEAKSELEVKDAGIIFGKLQRSASQRGGQLRRSHALQQPRQTRHLTDRVAQSACGTISCRSMARRIWCFPET